MLYPALAITALGAAWLRSKTGEVAPLTDSNLDEMGAAVCDAFEAAPAFETPKGIAAAVGAAAYPGLAWPPLPLATASHRQAWAALQLWAAELATAAAGAGLTVCDWLKQTKSAPSIEATLKLAEVKPAVELDAAPLAPVVIGEAAILKIVTDEPTPGSWYRIKYGDTFLGIVGQAYNVGSGMTRYQLSRQVNDHPSNAGLVRGPASNLYPQGRISFMPPFQTLFFP